MSALSERSRDLGEARLTTSSERDALRPQRGALWRGWASLSYRLKVPMVITLAILVTTLATASTLIARAYVDARQELIGNAMSLARTLARGLTPILLRDDVWRAYEIVMAPLAASDQPAENEKLIVVLDADDMVYVSSDPHRLPVLSSVSRLGPGWDRIQARIAETVEPRVIEGVDPERIVVAVPIRSEDEDALGSVVLAYDRSLLLPRFYEALRYVVLSTLGVLAVLLPIGWYMGNRIATPLVGLADCMTRVGSEPLDDVACDARLPKSGDEIGRLAARFEKMLVELKEKQALERRMIATDRLAAIGRLTAGIAHEINNPLGGMLNAVNTYRRHGSGDPLAMKTLALLERGLVQIKETVGALLVEARVESHALARADLEDVRLLIEPEAQKKGLAFRWQDPIGETLPLPSTPVRQILINLLLNAVEAAEEGGRIACHLAADDSAFYVRIRNSGRGIPPERMQHLFEPFDGASGNGLGLWVTYQIVQQLGGAIAAESAEGETVFTVRLPMGAT